MSSRSSLFADYTLAALTVFFVTLGCARDRLRRRLHEAHATGARSACRAAGSSSLLVAITVVVGVVAHHEDFSTEVYVPVVDVDVAALATAGTCSSSS